MYPSDLLCEHVTKIRRVNGCRLEILQLGRWPLLENSASKIFLLNQHNPTMFSCDLKLSSLRSKQETPAEVSNQKLKMISLNMHQKQQCELRQYRRAKLPATVLHRPVLHRNFLVSCSALTGGGRAIRTERGKNNWEYKAGQSAARSINHSMIS